jgi:transposase
MLCIGSVEDRVPPGHPIRGIKRLADECLKAMDAQFEAMYSVRGRPSIPPERLLKAQLLMALFSVSSERTLCERIDYDLMFRFFLDMDMVEPTFDPTTFTQNRDRLLASDAAHAFLKQVVELGRSHSLMSAEHFSVDGTLIEAWASHKSFRPKDEDPDDKGDGNRWSGFKGEKRSNETHESKTDPDARLARKGSGQPAKLSYSAHALMENRNGLIVDFEVDAATGTAERDVAIKMIERTPGEDATLAADKGYDTKDFVQDCTDRWVVPHMARNISGTRRSAVPDDIAATPEYAISIIVRRRIEQIFGWMKEVGGFRRTRYRGRPRVRAHGQLVAAAYNLLRISRLIAA